MPDGAVLAVVDLASPDVLWSDRGDRRYPMDLAQNRQMTSERELTIQKMAGDFNPERVLSTSGTYEGVPTAAVLDGSLVVLIGSTRTAAADTAYGKGTAGDLKARTMQWAGEHGFKFDGEAPARPMLMRILPAGLTHAQMSEIVQKGNQSPQQAQTAAKDVDNDARVLAEHLEELLPLLRPTDSADFISGANVSFAQRFVELAGHRTGDSNARGEMTSALNRRIQNALLGYLFQGMPRERREWLMENVVADGELGDLGIKNAIGGLVDRIGGLLRLEQDNRQYSLVGELQSAVDNLATFRQRLANHGVTSASDYLQGDPLLDAMDAQIDRPAEMSRSAQAIFLRLANAKFRKAVRDFFDAYLDEVSKQVRPEEDLFGTGPQNKFQLLARLTGEDVSEQQKAEEPVAKKAEEKAGEKTGEQTAVPAGNETVQTSVESTTEQPKTEDAEEKETKARTTEEKSQEKAAVPAGNETVQTPEEATTEQPKKEGAKEKGAKASTDEGKSEEQTSVSAENADETAQAAAEPPAVKAVEFEPTDKRLEELANVFAEPGLTPQIRAARLSRLAREWGTDQKSVEEWSEYCIARMVHDLQRQDIPLEEKWRRVLAIYQGQPALATRTSTSVVNQAYSTPAPLAWILGNRIGLNNSGAGIVYEPTAGTGMLVAATSGASLYLNEIDPRRRKILRRSDADFLRTPGVFSQAQVTGEDARTFVPNAKGSMPRQLIADFVVANPPFDTAPPLSADGFRLTKLDHQIAANALNVLRPEGRAFLIVGANLMKTGLNKGQATLADKVFMNFLYSHFNVQDNLILSGDLYRKQGASFPLRVFTINGRKKYSGEMTTAPLHPDMLHSWEEVHDRLIEPWNPYARDNAQGQHLHQAWDEFDYELQEQSDASSVDDNGVLEEATETQQEQSVEEEAIPKTKEQEQTVQEKAGQEGDKVRSANPAPTQVRPGSELPGGRYRKYTSAAQVKDGGMAVDSWLAMQQAQAQAAFLENNGDPAEFVKSRLGIASDKELSRFFLSHQVDGIALAISKMEKGGAMVIGDGTGAGKGRLQAGVMRWAIRNGRIPVFATVSAPLFTDMYFDGMDVGQEFRPVIFADATQGSIVNRRADGQVIQQVQTQKERERLIGIMVDRVAKGKPLADDMPNAVFITYSQLNSKGIGPQLTQLLRIRDTGKAVFVLDEAHTAAGMNGNKPTNTNRQLSTAIANSPVLFSSATFSKRPELLAFYAPALLEGTDIDPKDLPKVLHRGGLPLLQFFTQAMAQSGAYRRVEKALDGVEIRMDTIGEENIGALKAAYDHAADILRRMMAMSRKIHVEGAQSGDVMATTDETTKAESASTFVSQVHNVINTILLAAKTDAAADEAVRAFREGRKPVIVVTSTGEARLQQRMSSGNLQAGSHISYSFADYMQDVLDELFDLPIESQSGNGVVRVQLDPEEFKLGGEYSRIQSLIRNNLSNVPWKGSPVDAIRDRLAKAGVRAGEISGRGLGVDYSGEQPTLAMRDANDRDRNEAIRKFNSGELDCLIINAAGSTGISLHASETFTDQRQRELLMVQPSLDITVVMQTLGRVHRVGSVVPPVIRFLSTPLMAEKRAMQIMAGKLRTLSAGTTADARSAVDVGEDILDRYGDEAASSWFYDHPTAVDEMEWILPEGFDSRRVSMRMLLGHLRVLSDSRQAVILNELLSRRHDIQEYWKSLGMDEAAPRDFGEDGIELLSEEELAPATGTGPLNSALLLRKVRVVEKHKGLLWKDLKAQGEKAYRWESPLALSEELQNNYSADLSTIEWASEVIGDLLGNAYFVNFGKPGQNAVGVFTDIKFDVPKDQDQESKEKAELLNVCKLRFEYLPSEDSELSAAKVWIPLSQLVNSADELIYRKLGMPAYLNGVWLERTTGREQDFMKDADPAVFFDGKPIVRNAVRYLACGNLIKAFKDVGRTGRMVNLRMGDSGELAYLLPKSWQTKDMIHDPRKDLKTARAAYDYALSSTKGGQPEYLFDKTGQLMLYVGRDGEKVVWYLSTRKEGRKASPYATDTSLTRIAGDFISSNRGKTWRTQAVMEGPAANRLRDVMNYLYAHGNMLHEKSESDNPYIFYRRAKGDEAGVDAEELRNAVPTMGFVCPIVITEGDDGLPYPLRQRMIQERTSGREWTGWKGFYDEETSTVYINADAHDTMEDARETLLHEAAVHHGLRAFFRSEKALHGFLDMASERLFYIRQAAMNKEAAGLEHYAAIEEAVADVAEDSRAKSVWERIAAWLKDAFAGLFRMVAGTELPSDTWLRQVLKDAAQAAREHRFTPFTGGMLFNLKQDLAKAQSRRIDLGLNDDFSPKRREEIRHGAAQTFAAMRELADGSHSVPLERPEIGEIQYDLGRTGSRGYGLLHIVEQRMKKNGYSLEEAAEVAVRTGLSAVLGVEEKAYFNKHLYAHGGVRAVVAFDNELSRPVITGFVVGTDATNMKGEDGRQMPHVRSDGLQDSFPRIGSEETGASQNENNTRVTVTDADFMRKLSKALKKAIGKLETEYNIMLSDGMSSSIAPTEIDRYGKFAEMLLQEGFNGTLLDAGTGLGAVVLREYGFSIDRTKAWDKGYNRDFHLREAIRESYDAVLADRFLEGVPLSDRADVLSDLASRVAPGGRLLVSGNDAKALREYVTRQLGQEWTVSEAPAASGFQVIATCAGQRNITAATHGKIFVRDGDRQARRRRLAILDRLLETPMTEWVKKNFFWGERRGNVQPIVNRLLQRMKGRIASDMEGLRVLVKRINDNFTAIGDKKIADELHHDLNGFLAGRDLSQNTLQLTTKDANARELVDAFREGRRLIDDLSLRMLHEMGDLLPHGLTLTISNNLGHYTLRAYEKFLNPNYRPTEEVVKRAQRAVKAELMDDVLRVIDAAYNVKLPATHRDYALAYVAGETDETGMADLPERTARRLMHLREQLHRAIELTNDAVQVTLENSIDDAGHDVLILDYAADNERLNATAQGVVDYLLSKDVESPDSGLYQGKSAARNKILRSSFLERQDLPDWLRELYGEITDCALVLQNTVSRGIRVLAANDMLKALRQASEELDVDNPQRIFYQNAYRNEGHDATVKLEGFGYGALNGWFTDRNTAAMLADYSGQGREVMLLWKKFISLSRAAKTAYNVPTHFRNILGNLVFAANDGMIFRPTWYRNWARAFAMLLSDSPDAVRERRHLMELGLIGSGAHAEEFSQTVRDAFGTPDVLNFPGRKILSSFVGGDSRAMEFAYALEDNVFRVASFYTRTADDGLTEDAAVANVRRLYPTYDQAPAVIDQWRRYNPLAPDFMAFRFESLRCMANSVADAWKAIKSGEMKEATLRVSGVLASLSLALGVFGTSVGGFLGGFGKDDDEKDAARMDGEELDALRLLLPSYRQDNTVLAWRDGAHIRYVDLGYIYPYEQWPLAWNILTARGRTADDRLTDMFKRVCGNYLIGNMAGDSIMDLMRNRTTYGQQVWDNFDPIWIKAAKGFGHLGQALVPSMFTFGARSLKLALSEEDSIVDAHGNITSAGTEALRMALPYRVYQFDPAVAYTRRMRSLAAQVREEKAKANVAWRRWHDGYITRDAAESEIERTRSIFADSRLLKQLHFTDNAGRILGLDFDRRFQLLKEAGFSIDEAERILTVRPLAYTLPEQ
ncbi:MAG: strawberry notch C-terminal domain-containing protein [Victivallales bacterium]|nr:strawberry notch C-terminal domain-containing protein [Victivallales bacterium]